MLDDTHRSSMSMCGTFAWVAPEILLGGRVSQKSDIYSLGVVMWEIATHVSTCAAFVCTMLMLVVACYRLADNAWLSGILQGMSNSDMRHSC